MDTATCHCCRRWSADRREKFWFILWQFHLSHIPFRTWVGSGCVGSWRISTLPFLALSWISVWEHVTWVRVLRELPRGKPLSWEHRPFFAPQHRTPMACEGGESLRGRSGIHWAEMLKWGLWSSAKKRPEPPGVTLQPQDIALQDVDVARCPRGRGRQGPAGPGREPAEGAWLGNGFCQVWNPRSSVVLSFLHFFCPLPFGFPLASAGTASLCSVVGPWSEPLPRLLCGCYLSLSPLPGDLQLALSSCLLVTWLSERLKVQQIMQPEDQ